MSQSSPCTCRLESLELQSTRRIRREGFRIRREGFAFSILTDFVQCTKTCAFGRGSSKEGHVHTRVVEHSAVRCRWGSNPAGPPTGRHCVPNSGRRFMQLTPWGCPFFPGRRACEEVQVSLGVVAATYSSPAVLVHFLGHYTIGICRVGACRHAGGTWPEPGGAAVVGVM
jgi:hypothetical protein